MAAQHYIFPTLASAQAVAAVVDLAHGYPRAGVDVGGGLHVPHAQSQTTTYATPRKHPKLARWAYPADAVTRPAIAAAAVVGLPVPGALDATWEPPTGPTGVGVVTAL